MISKLVVKTIFNIAMKVLSLIVWGILILASYGGYIPPSITSFPSILTLALPYIASVSLVLLLYWIIRRKILFSIAGVGVILICISPLSQAFPISFSKKASGEDQTFRMMTWNILHTEDIRNPDSPGNPALEYIMKSGCDVVCLQEMLSFNNKEIRNYSDALADSLFNVYPYHAGGWDTDVKILSKYPCTDLIPQHFDASPTRQLFDAFRIEIDGHPVTFVVVHLSSYNMSDKDAGIVKRVIVQNNGLEESLKQYRSTVKEKLAHAFVERNQCSDVLRKYLDTLTGDIIVCGDFNDVPASWAYRKVRGDDFRDAYSETGFGPMFTYNTNLLYFHIDQILYKGDLRPLKVSKGKIKTSDHYPVIAEFEFTDSKK